jgi:hypothetical protein
VFSKHFRQSDETKPNMSTYLEELAVRFVERDGLSLEDQQKIAVDAADCLFKAPTPSFSKTQSLPLTS